MMFFILAAVALVVGIVGCLLENRHPDKLLWLLVCLLGFSAAMLLVAGGFNEVNTANQGISVFLSQKDYVKAHVPSDAVENAALTAKKIELNEWLNSGA